MTPEDAFKAEVRQNLDGLARDEGLAQRSRDWVLETSRHKYSYNFRWLGRPIIQYPQDIVALQEIVWQVRPDVIVETGIAHGGSLVLSASLLALLDLCDAQGAGRALDPATPGRRVVGVDIDIRAHNRAAIEAHPLASRIAMIEGSSIDPATAAQVRAACKGARSVLVCLDSNHTHEHVLAELRAYAPLVTRGSYCIVFDTVIERMPKELHAQRPWGPGNSPMSAVDAWLAELAPGRTKGADGAPLAFDIDGDYDAKLMVGVAPRGYLRRR